MSFANARKKFEAVQLRYVKFGACDTEPLEVFFDLIAQAHRGAAPTVPTTVSGWQLFSDMPGNRAAADALAAAASAAVTAANADAVGAAAFINGGF